MIRIKQNIARIICTLSVLLIGSNILLSANLIGEHSKYHYLEYVKHNKKQIKGNDEGVEEINLVCDLTKDPFDTDLDFTYVEQHYPKIEYYVLIAHDVRSNCYINYSPSFKKNSLWIKHRQILI